MTGKSKYGGGISQIPNILTVGRLVLTVLFLGMILYWPKIKANSSFLDIAFIIFVVAGLTDIIDGHIARTLDVTSKFGRMMDPLVDKVLVCGAFICFAVIGEPKLFNLGPPTLAVIQWFTAAVIVLREGFVTILRHRAEARGINFAATVSGKIKMFVQSFGIGTVIIRAAHVQNQPWGYWFTAITFAVVIAITVVSGVSSIRRGQAAA